MKDLTLKNKISKSLLQPEKRVYCPPYLSERTCTMLYAPRGIGKSHFAFNMAFAIANKSSWLGKQCDQGKVMYIDGEMGADTWVKRLPKDQVFPSEVTNNLHMLNPEDYKNNMIPSMASTENYEYWTELLQSYDVIIIDNYLTVVYPEISKDTELSLWYSFLRLLLTLKMKGKAVLIVHHSTKTGQQYGSVLKENQMNTIIRLRQFPEQLLANGLTWEVKIEKDRDNVFEKESEFAMDIVFTDQEVITRRRDMSKLRENLIKDCMKDGMSRSEIALFLGVETFQISHIYKKAKLQEKNNETKELI